MMFASFLCSLLLATGPADSTIKPKLLLQTPDKPIRDMAVAADGSIFTFDYTDYRIKKFDRDGRFLFDCGGKGTGPGQFTHLTGIRAFDDKLLAVDSVGLLEFDLDGRLRGKTAFAEEITPNYSAALTDGRYVGFQIVASELKAVLTFRSREGRELGRLASHELKEFFPDLKKGEEFFLSDDYARNYLYAVGPGNEIVWTASDALRVRRFLDGASRTVLSADLTPLPVPADLRARLQARKDKARPPFFAYVPDRLPLVCHLALGTDGEIWVYVQSREKTGFLRYAKDGTPKGFAAVDADFDVAKAVVRIFGGRMFFISGKSLYAADLPAD